MQDHTTSILATKILHRFVRNFMQDHTTGIHNYNNYKSQHMLAKHDVQYVSMKLVNNIFSQLSLHHGTFDLETQSVSLDWTPQTYIPYNLYTSKLLSYKFTADIHLPSKSCALFSSRTGLADFPECDLWNIVFIFCKYVVKQQSTICWRTVKEG